MSEATLFEQRREPAGRLMLLDVYGLVYRAFFALPPLTTTKGVAISAAYGFTMMLRRLIAEERPTHLIACFDKGLPLERIQQFKEYKAQRQETPDDLRSQFPLVRRVLEAYRIPVAEYEGKEADDVIATLAHQAESDGFQTLIVTGDMDLLQLVDQHTTVLATRRGISDLSRYDPAAVRERFALEPGQLVDYRGLKGDPSDNLPGIPGVGEKTAIKLLQAAGSLDALIAQPELAGSEKLADLIRTHGEQARVCRDVSRVDRSVPISRAWEQARYVEPEDAQLYPLFAELEFKTLLAKLQAPSGEQAPPRPEEVGGNYHAYVSAVDPPDLKRLAALVAELRAAEAVAVFYDPGSEQIGLTARAGEGLSLTLGAALAQPVRPHFEALWATPVAKLAHNAKPLLRRLYAAGIEPAGLRDDTMVAAHLLNPSRAYGSLDEIVSEHLDLSLPGDPAAGADAIVRLVPMLRERLAEREQLSLYAEVETALVPVLAQMEEAGIALDGDALREMSTGIAERAAEVQRQIFAQAGHEFNLASPQQLGKVLFDDLHLPGGKRTKTGWGTGAEILQSLARDFPIAALVLEWRELTKLQSTYVDVLPTLVDARGRLHTQWHQTTTATGRISSTNPNLQNIPVRTELGRRVRKAFVASAPDRVLLAADYSQIELRLMAHLSGDESMRAAFHEGQDIHDFTARRIFDVPQGTKATADQRRMAKAVNFGLLYGMSDFGLAQRLEIDRAAAHEISQAYFARFPSVRAFLEGVVAQGRERGYVSTILGRRRYLPDLRAKNFAVRGAAEREAVNAPVQGSAADLVKLAMVRAQRILSAQRLDARMLLQIHDELLFDVAERSLDATVAVVRREMEDALDLSVPLQVSIKVGRTWHDVDEYDPAAFVETEAP
ncbi:MAG: DNA polymerase I [bacterium]|nr:DNA polymerase I [bacterium]